jgi:hypothetical protein
VLEDLPEEVRKEVQIVFVTDVRQVLALALEPIGETADARSSSGSESETVRTGEAPALEPVAPPKAARRPRPSPRPRPIAEIVPNPARLH